MSENEKHNEKMKRLKTSKQKIFAKKTVKKGLIIVHTGTGKGKSTAAFGMVFRGIAHGMSCAVVQFIKGTWATGEKKFLVEKYPNECQFFVSGDGFTWDTQDREKDINLVKSSWIKALSYLKDPNYKLIILDEIIVAIKLGYIDESEIIKGINLRPELTHVFLTGRGASKNLIDSADLVTEMKLIHHPFREQGVKAQEGIEY